MSGPMMLVVNGRERECDAAATIPSLVRDLLPARFTTGNPGSDDAVLMSGGANGIAVAINGTLVPRSQWRTTPLGDGDRVDVVTAVQGG